MLNLKFVKITDTGYILCKVPNHVLSSISNEVDELMKKNFTDTIPYNDNLAGAIQHEYVLTKCRDKLNNYIELIAPLYWTHLNDVKQNVRHFIKQNNNGHPDLWANFQKKHEHNPPHTHAGDLSFVIWLKVPYDIEKEKRLPNLSKALNPSAGAFYFTYPDNKCRGGIGFHYIQIDKNKEGYMAIFRSDLHHAVLPFYTSENYRVSISGNIGIDT